MGSSTGVAFHQLHPQPQEVLAQGLEAPGAANFARRRRCHGQARQEGEHRLPAGLAAMQQLINGQRAKPTWRALALQSAICCSSQRGQTGFRVTLSVEA
jgi:hypothetical protein